MTASLFRLVVDTNVLLAGLASESSASQRIVDALTERRVIPLLSQAVLSEYRAVLMHADVTARFANLTGSRVAMALHKLRYVADVYAPRTKFDFARDPRDAKFIELAIAGRATHILTMDADLLSLVTGRTEAARRFRQRLPDIKVVRPGELIEALRI